MQETFKDIFTLFAYLGIPLPYGQIPHRPAHFAYDPMSTKVRSMQSYRIYSEDALQKAFICMPNIAANIDDARGKMIAHGCKFVNYAPFSYTQQELEFIRKELHQMYLDSY